MAKKNKRNDSYLSIRKKLIAAVAMLLVASFMVASSSYAWFTLSTAPEVTGIQTSVGANGSLEIALYSGTTEIGSAVGDGNKSAVEKNITWGNQINLNDPSYGLDNITLYPARLNYDGTSINSTPLLTPEYAADGRVKSLEANTVMGMWDTTKNEFGAVDGKYGVRAIGTVSGMTDQELDWRNAKSAVSTELNSALTKAQDSLAANADALASMAIQKATGATEFNISFVPAMVTALEASNEHIGKAIVAYVKGAAALAYANESDYSTTYRTQLALLQIDKVSIANGKITITVGDFSREITLPNTSEAEQKIVADLTAIYSIYTANAETIADVKTELEAVPEGGLANVAWSGAEGTPTVASILLPLVNVEKVTVNGIASGDLMNSIPELVAAVTSGISVELAGATETTESAGIYADIADVCGEDITVDATITVPAGTYGTIPIKEDMPLDATMRTVTTRKYQLYAMLGTEAPATDNSGNTKMTDFYGYVVDLAFRTNAKGSSLMLQTTPIDRISSTGSTEATMGGGSSMTFTLGDNDYTLEQAKKLMAAIRIAFVDDTGAIVALGGLGSNTTGDATGAIKADIYLYDFAAEVQGEGLGSIIKRNSLKLSDKDGAQPITPLNPNEVKIMSVYVYLDGDVIQNGDVANAETSLTGTLNLQFSSSEELIPMDYTFDADVVGPAEKTEVVLSADNIANGNVTITTNNYLTLPAQVDSVDVTEWKVIAGSNATVSGNKLTPSREGAVTVQYTTASGTGNVIVTIENAFVAVTGITVADLEVTQGEELQLAATVEPTGASYKTIVWSTAETAEGFAIDAAGNVTTTAATPAGNYTVTATIANGTATGAYTQNFTVKVVAATPAP